MTAPGETNRPASPPPQSDEPKPLVTPGRGIAPAASWQRHKRVGIAVAACIALVGVPLILWKSKPVYSAEAALRVAPSFAKNLQDDEEFRIASNTQYLMFVSQQVTTIRSFDVAIGALERLGDKRSMWQDKGESDRRAAERLMAALEVRSVPNTYLIAVSLSGSKPDGLADIVNAVTEAYLTKAVEETFYGTDIRILSLEKQRTELEDDIRGHVETLSNLAAQLGVSTFKEDSLNPLDSLLAATDLALADYRRQRIVASSKLEALEEAQQREAKISVDAAAQALLDRNVAVNSAIRLSQERRDKLMSLMSGLTEGHPGYALMQRQLADIDAEFRKVFDAEYEAAKARLTQQRQAQADQELSRAKAEVDQTSAAVTKLENEYASEQARLAEYSKDYQTAIDQVREITRARKRVEAINNRIDFLMVEQEAPGFLRVATPARLPEIPSKSLRKPLVLGVLLLSGLLLFGLPIAIDRFNLKILVPADLEKALGFPPVAWFAERVDAATSKFTEDQLRRLALSLEREWRTRGISTVALSGINPGTGVTTVTLDLARELNALGVRTLAIETDSLNPDRRYQGDSPSGGLSAVFQGSLRPSQAIVAAADRLPDRLPVGNPKETPHLSSVNAWHALFAELKGTYDLVLLDAAPVLGRVDGELVTQAAEGAMMVVQAGTITSGDAKRAARVFERLDPQMFASVLTRVQMYHQGSAYTRLLHENGSAPTTSGKVTLLQRLRA